MSEALQIISKLFQTLLTFTEPTDNVSGVVLYDDDVLDRGI